MAETQIQATLGLRITAKDEAKQVFADFAKNLETQMTTIQESLRKGFNMTTIQEDVEKACTAMSEAFGKVKTAEEKLTNGNVSSDLEKQMTAISESVAKMEESVTKNLTSVAESASSMKTKMSEALDGIKVNGIESQMTSLTESVGKMASSVEKGFTNVASSADKMKTHMNQASTGINYMEIQNAGMYMEDAGKRLLGFFGEAAKAGVDFDQSIVNTTASLNANLQTTKLSTSQIDAMKQSALDMGSAGFFSANQISEAMNTMAKQGISYNTIMSGGIQTVYKVAAANQQDLEETANVVSDIYNEMSGEFKSMGLTTKQSAQIIGNSMTVALHHARLSMSDFLATMKYVGPQASAVGMSIQDVSASIALLGQHGIKASQAGTTLRRMLTNLTPTTKAQKDMFDQLGLTTKNGGSIFYDASGKMKSMADIQQILHDKISGLTQEQQQLALKTIFGQYALSGMTAIVGAAPKDFQKLTAEMKNNGEMDEILNEKKKGLGFQVQALQAHFATLQKEIGMALAPLLVSLIGIANKLMDAWSHLPSGVQKAIVIFGAVAGVLLTVGGALFTLIGTVGMFMSSWDLAIGALATIGTALAPVLIAIGLLVVVFVAVRKAWQKDIGGIREYVQKFVAWFQPIFGKTMGKVKSDVESGLKALTKGFTGWQRDIMEPVNKAMSVVWSTISSGMKKLVTVVSQGITAVTGWFKKMAPQFNQALHRIIAFIEWLAPVWKAMWAVLKFAVSLAFDWIVGIIKHFWGLFSGIIQLVTDAINGKWKNVFKDLWQIIKNALLLALDLWGGFAGKFFGGIARLLERVGIFGPAFTKLFSVPFKAAEKILDGMWKYVEKIWSNVYKATETALKLLYKYVDTIFTGIKLFVKSHGEEAMAALKKAWTAGVNAGKAVLNFLWNAVKSVFQEIKDLFGKEPNKWFKGFLDTAKSFFNMVKNGFKTMYKDLVSVFKMLKSDLTEWWGKCWKAIKITFTDTVSSVKNLLNSWGSWIKTEFNKIKDSLEKPVQAALSFLKKIFSTEISAIKAIINAFKAIVQTIFAAIENLIHGHGAKAMTLLEQAFRIGISAVKSILHNILSAVDGIFGGLPSKMLGYGSRAVSSFKSALSNGISYARNNAGQIIAAIGSALSNLPGKMHQWAVNGMSMFVSGIESGINKIKSAVSKVGSTIKDFLGMHSPARMGPLGPGESDKWFPNMMGMFEKGINDNKDKIQNAVKGVAVGVQSTITGTQQHIHQVVTGSRNVAGSAITNNSTSSQRQQVVNISIEGRSAQTDKQLAENIAKQFRSQMSMITS